MAGGVVVVSGSVSRKEYMRLFRQTAKYKEQQKNWYLARKEKVKEYNSRPEVLAKKRAYYRSPRGLAKKRAYMRVYRLRPDVLERNRMRAFSGDGYLADVARGTGAPKHLIRSLVVDFLSVLGPGVLV